MLRIEKLCEWELFAIWRYLEIMTKCIFFTLLLSSASSFAQSFDVASIKPNSASDNRVRISIQPGGRFTATGMSLRMLTGQAFGMRDFQITGLPGWASADRYDIEAKSEGMPERLPPDQLRPYLKALVEERFQLKSHIETKEMPVYALVVGKNGSKLKASEAPGPMIRMGRGQLNGKGMPMDLLVAQLSQQLGRMVINKTGLSGAFDIELEWTPEPGQGGGGPGGPPPPDGNVGVGASGPSIFTAVQEQLGLRLESTKGPVEVLVVDSVAKPTEN